MQRRDRVANSSNLGQQHVRIVQGRTSCTTRAPKLHDVAQHLLLVRSSSSFNGTTAQPSRDVWHEARNDMQETQMLVRTESRYIGIFERTRAKRLPGVMVSRYPIIAYGTLSRDMCLGALGLIDGSLLKKRTCMSHVPPLNACGCSRNWKRKTSQRRSFA
jgi:hypothetical protein